jgi:hypothetical protein
MLLAVLTRVLNSYWHFIRGAAPRIIRLYYKFCASYSPRICYVRCRNISDAF